MKLVEQPKAIGTIFNVGGKEEIPIERLAHLVKEVLQSPSSIGYVPYEEAYEDGFEDMQKRVPDLTNIQRLIAYEPQYSLHDIILDVAKYQRKRESSSAWRVSL